MSVFFKRKENLMVETVCIRKCFSGGNLYNEGDKRNFKDDEKIPAHFEPTAKHEEKVKEQKEVEEKGITDLQAELDNMGIPYDKRWGKGSLEKAIAVALKENKAGR